MGTTRVGPRVFASSKSSFWRGLFTSISDAAGEAEPTQAEKLGSQSRTSER